LTRAIAYVGLGSNLAHPRRQLARALARLARIPLTRIVAVSRNFESAPIGAAEPQPDYVNAVALLSTSLSPRALLARLLAIERRHGRRRTAGMRPNAARPLDLDLLLYGRVRMRLPALVLPHPRMHERAFVLRPLIDVAPTATIPGHGLARRLVRNVRSQRVAPTRADLIH
jgi:2-amino-4-hydroxy-6-hydroxymethyldihydropteridine diphosphokinase